MMKPLTPYSKHILFCVGGSCGNTEESLKLFDYLRNQLKALGLDSGEGRIMRSKSTCLGVCGGGPVAVVYPEAIWYGSLDQAKIDRIIQEHLIEGIPAKDLILPLERVKKTKEVHKS